MGLVKAASRLYNRFLNRYTRRDSLDILPNDVLLEIMSHHLEVVEVIRLRMVSKLYHALTHEPCIWTHLLRRADVPLPPIPPSLNYSKNRISTVEAERILTRAHSLDRNWAQHHPRPLAEWTFHTYHRIHSMTLLPGGEYLVASVSNATMSRYSLAIYAMNTSGPLRAIAAIDTPTKAYEIKAKYMTVNNHKSIVIAYLSRDYHHKTDRKKAALGRLQNVSQFSTHYPIDAEVVFRYECVALHVTLENLQSLLAIPHHNIRQYRQDVSFLHAPFVYLVSVRSRSMLRCPVLDTMFGSPYFAVVKGANDIVFKRLDWGASATLTCTESPALAQSNHTIKSIRLLPGEHNVFVVREVDVPRTYRQRCPMYLFETYHAMKSGPTQMSQLRAAEECVVARELGNLTHIYIPDVPPSSQVEDFLPENDRIRLARRSEPPLPVPVTVLAHKRNEEAVVRASFYYQRIVSSPPPSPPSAGGLRSRGTADASHRKQVIYRLNLNKGWCWERPAGDENMCLRIIPGLVRPLIYWTPWDDLTDAPVVQDMRPFIDRRWEKPLEVDEGDVVKPRSGFIGFPPFDGWPTEDMRVKAFAWDETSGRLLIAEEDSDEVRVCDFAAGMAPTRNERV